MKKLCLFTAAVLLLFSGVSIAEEPEETVILSFPSYVDESALAETYITSSLPQKRNLLRVTRPSGLIQFPDGTPNRNLYLALRSRITHIADGTGVEEVDDDIGGISTVFAIPAGELFSETSFTAEDLGVEELYNSDGTITASAEAAFQEMIDGMKDQIRFTDVAYCVINDSPYELYWFGRTASVLRNDFHAENGGTELLLQGNYYVFFNVSKDYAVDEEHRSRIDPDKYGSVTRAKNQITRIRNAAAGMTDEEKIRFFAAEICRLVSYNSDAERDFKTGKLEYGDPWQLVWVFDTASEQKVVCEGYSKAFDYLCGLETEHAVSYLIWGEIPGGAHMWNIVNMDGYNYLVDVTNYDQGFDLILVGAVDGNVTDGYDTAAAAGYKYNRTQTMRSDEELTLAPFSYSEWKEATTNAPAVQISSDRTYPGYQVAVKAESSNGVLPVESLIVSTGEESGTIALENGIGLLDIDADVSLRFAAVIDGKTTPETEPMTIAMGTLPESVFSLPAGSLIAYEAFTGIAAELIRVNGNSIAPGAFDPDVVLAVDEAGNWFDSGYRFVTVVVGNE